MELSVVVPTFNERRNVETLVHSLESALDGIEWEIIFVDDDSDDQTSGCVKELAVVKANVRCIHRIGRRGLSSACIEGILSSSACIEGILSSSAPNVAVMDADLQHDERLLPKMLQLLQDDSGLHLVVGSRFIEGGGTGSLAEHRVQISKFASWFRLRHRLDNKHARQDWISREMSGEMRFVLSDILNRRHAFVRRAIDNFIEHQKRLAVRQQFLDRINAKRIGIISHLFFSPACSPCRAACRRGEKKPRDDSRCGRPRPGNSMHTRLVQ